MIISISDLNLITIFATTLLCMYLVSTFSKNIKEYKLHIEKGLLHDVGHIDITRLKYSISYFFVVVSQILGRKKSSGRNRIVQS